MVDRIEDLRSIYREMDSENLLERVKAGTLTEEAHSVALAELAHRGAVLDSLPKDPVELPLEVIPAKPNFLVRAWSGKERLWIIFWVAGFILNIPFALAVAIRHPVFGLALYGIGVVSRLFWLGCVWRSAFRSSHWVWAVLARGYVALDVTISGLVLLRTLS